MNFKRLGPVALMALALLVLANTATATTLEISGVKQNVAVTIKASLKFGTSLLLTDTFGGFANTCTDSAIEGKTSTFTGSTVSEPLSTLTFSSCTNQPVVVDTLGSLTYENIAGTANGTVRSIGAKFTSPSPFGALTCTTAASPGTDIGTLTGVSSGSATLDINALMNCGFFLPCAKLSGTYTVTTPTALAVTS
jgi:hypothetical protein